MTPNGLYFGVSGDLLYGAGLLLGVAVSFVVRKSALRRRWVLFFNLLSLSVVFIAASLCVSALHPDIVTCLVALGLAILAAVAVRFPLALGIPCVVASGALVVIFSLLFLSLPPYCEDSSLGGLLVEKDASCSVRMASGVNWKTAKASIEVIRVSIDHRYPFVRYLERMTVVPVDGSSSGGRTITLMGSPGSHQFPGVRITKERVGIPPGLVQPGRYFRIIERNGSAVLEAR